MFSIRLEPQTGTDYAFNNGFPGGLSLTMKSFRKSDIFTCADKNDIFTVSSDINYVFCISY